MIKLNELRQVKVRKTSELIPYENNPRDNDKAVAAVAASIREFGFNVPIIIDKDDIIVAGHTRLKAAEKLGLDEVPTIKVGNLTDEEVRAFRLADNKTAELAEWNFDLLDSELAEISEINMDAFGFGGYDFFSREKRNDTEREEGNEEYNEFLDKFEAKKTTDDCYTPELVYEAVADWVAAEYGVKRENFIRPFYPGGDYKKEKYKETDIVVDNPPFSILAKILRYYNENDVKFFLFAPTLTLFSSSSSSSSCALPCGVGITYENGASVSTSFLTNLEDEDLRFRTCHSLYKAVEKANDEWLSETRREVPKYNYPNEVVTAPNVARFTKYGIEFRVNRSESVRVSILDAQRDEGKAIYGKGYLISEKAAAEKAAAEKAAAEKAVAEKAAATRWTLSEREWEIIRGLSDGKEM